MTNYELIIFIVNASASARFTFQLSLLLEYCNKALYRKYVNSIVFVHI